MSRNVRKKVTTPRRPKRRDSDTTSASSIDLSDDDGYSAVEDITDSEDDDEDDVDAVEEENIRTEAVAKPLPSPRPPTDDDDDDDDDDDEALDQFEIEVDVSVDGNGEFEDDDEQASWAGIVSDGDDNHVTDFYIDADTFIPDVAAERHVHFDIPSSDSDSTDTDDDHGDLFPDIFVAQNSLDPAFRKEIENDLDDGSSDSGTFWDYTGQHHGDDNSDAEDINETPTATPHNNHIKSEDTGPASPIPEEFYGCESDGDTTEEDTPEPSARKRTRRLSVAISEMTDSESEPVKTERGHPRVGRFKLDRSDKKPIAVLNPLTRKMMIFTPHRRHQYDLSPEQMNFPWPFNGQTEPLGDDAANMMFNAMLSSEAFTDYFNTQPNALFPLPVEGGEAEASSPSMEADDDDAESNLKMSDFITWDKDDSSGEEDEAGNWQPSSTPIRPTTASSEIDVLSHLNSETVGAFRRNQINQQLILSNQATQDSLALSGPYNHTALRGLKSDRFDTAGMPLTPIRRQKKHLSDIARSPLENASAKRKASSEATSAGHKRHRSISDVNMLRI
ncbi:Amidase [Cordyceps fumosorosea ARSEF 2679]|uniref:Amidase n=1 Tax=Cordyceps fumosorosea (strain ARSEF 2679) TaxID=1081104 RepID=A0A162I801_CORFA|nr:Amidase [Cordyceps fumosorosea ARSEF 2679]OAA53535.1 Amidase [Cordyceps fumosorosea ARSEF 2679]